ncbi:hypothetical protein QRC94_002198 [Vibrio vulnificus]|uniref:hypothetical protein n=1 Tax=Vibrio vulnificus TaxID=672 RepID=UPI0009B688BB|nr:hypothetical protein [Vibrio vulnificus]EGR1512271.1 hypothetical protein [Vibrio vulnificus]EJA3103518.1 hypothetical protein [Vibrio vulnificus]EJC6744714.1 hypothetical protein [Vibrio vulnificus]EJC6819985.1 hypothetical protein [Vibrio vulnificus]EJC6953698.1 hypothetical protein [Vibrio vulnificus]
MEKLIEQFKQTNVSDELSSPLVQWGGLVCVIILLWWLVLEPYYQWREDYIGTLHQKVSQLERLEKISASRSEIETYAKALEAVKQQAEQTLIDTRTHSRALGQQVDLFDSIYRPKGLSFTGRRFGEPKIAPWFGEKVESQWRITGTSDDILQMLFDLGNNKEIIEVSKFEIKQGVKQRGDVQPRYEIAIDLLSYRKLPEAQLKAESRR